MFVRSDRAPNLSDPIIIFMFGSSIIVYTLLSLMCINIIYARSGKKNMSLQTGEAYSENEHGEMVSFNRAFIGVLLGASIFLFQQAV